MRVEGVQGVGGGGCRGCGGHGRKEKGRGVLPGVGREGVKGKKKGGGVNFSRVLEVWKGRVKRCGGVMGVGMEKVVFFLL